MTEKIKHTIQLFSFIESGCEICDENIRHHNDDGELSKAINHYIQKHDYKLLHLGDQTVEGDDGLWRGVTAVLGSEVVPPPKEPSELVVIEIIE